MVYADIEKSFEKTNFSKEQKAFIIAKTWHEFLEGQSKEIDRKIVAENVFCYPRGCASAGFKKGDRITDPENLCMLVDNKEEWERYYNLYFAECQKRGIARAYNEVITSESSMLYRKAGDILIDWFLSEAKKYKMAKELVNLDIEYAKKNLIYRNKILDLAMNWKAA